MLALNIRADKFRQGEKKFDFAKIYNLMTIYILGKISQEIFY